MLRSRAGRAPRLLCAVLTLMSLATPSSAAFLQIHDAKHWFAFGAPPSLFRPIRGSLSS